MIRGEGSSGGDWVCKGRWCEDLVVGFPCAIRLT